MWRYLIMKATELRIGNYVELRGETTTIWKVSKETIHAEPFNSPMCDEIKPILLTEEWLLKFGFEKLISKEKGFKQNTYYMQKPSWSLYEICENCYSVRFWIGCELKYVHSLQNLYFALTGQELTIKTNNK